MRYKLTIAYDGTNYAGWQFQESGIGVQQRIEEALGKIFPGTGLKRLHSSSRTDAGVHARGMVAHVDIPEEQFKLSPTKLALAINAYLDDDIRIMAAEKCSKEFHARFDAKGKQYRYQVWNHFAMDPLLLGQAWHVGGELDVKAMKAAAKLFIGKHDFKSFTNTRNYEMESTVRRLTKCEIKRSAPLLTFIIEGEGFLYKMCRGIVGTLVQIGQGKIAAGDIKKILKDKDRESAGMTAPAHGLILWEVYYERRPART